MRTAENIAALIEELAGKKKIPISRLLKECGLSGRVVDNMKVGSMPSADKLGAIADYLGVSTDHLLGKPIGLVKQKKIYRRIPVLGRIPAGVPLEAVEDEIDWEDIGEDLLRGGHEYIGLQIHGGSMLPEYRDNDVIIVRLQSCADTGDDVVAFVNGDDATFKRLSKNERGIYLRPLNPEFEPLFFSNKEIEELPVAILGIAVEVRRKLR